MDIKKWLSRAYKIDIQIVSKEEQIEMWRNLANKTTASYGSVGGSSGGVSHRLEEYCCKIADAEMELEKEKTALVDIKQEIKATIDKVSDVCHRVLLEQRYLMSKSWIEIADFMGYTEQYVKQDVHSQGLQQIRKILCDS